MADYNLRLSQLHEYGWVQFGPTPLGELSIILREYSQEGMELRCKIFEDFSDKAPVHEDGECLRVGSGAPADLVRAGVSALRASC
jgi:hypothetical protein